MSWSRATIVGVVCAPLGVVGLPCLFVAPVGCARHRRRSSQARAGRPFLSQPPVAVRGVPGAGARLACRSAGAVEDELGCAGARSAGAGGSSLSSVGSAGSTRPSVRFRSSPLSPAEPSSARRILPSRGCRMRRCCAPTRDGAVAHLHSPQFSVWSWCPRGRAGLRAHPGQSQSGSTATSGNLHTPRSRVCSRSPMSHRSDLRCDRASARSD